MFKKWQKIYMISMVVFLVVLFICAITIKWDVIGGSLEIKKMIGNILIISVAILLLSVYIFILANLIVLCKKGGNNIKSFEDEIFGKIDEFYNSWTEENIVYIQNLQIIKLYYKEGGIIDDLVHNKEIRKLYARKDYLLSKKDFFDNIYNCMISFSISVIASLVLQISDINNAIVEILALVLLASSLLAIVVMKYIERGQAGTYRHLLYEHELKLLERKIEKVENRIMVTDDDEKVLRTKQIIKKELIEIKSKNIKRKHTNKQIEKDIECVEKLILCLDDYTNCYWRKMCLNEQEIYLVYDKEKGKENNYIGALHLKTEEYSILYEILVKYEMLNYSEI